MPVRAGLDVSRGAPPEIVFAISAFDGASACNRLKGLDIVISKGGRSSDAAIAVNQTPRRGRALAAQARSTISAPAPIRAEIEIAYNIAAAIMACPSSL